MSTLSALRDDFYTNGGRGWRLATMMVLTLLLMPILFLSNLAPFYLDLAVSFKCAWDRIPSGDAATLSSISTSIYFVLFTLGSYTRRIVALYPGQNPREHASLAFFLPKVRQLRRERHEKASFNKFALAVWIADKRSGRTPTSGPPKSWLYMSWLLLQELKESFFWEVIWLAFYFTFGITSLVRTWKFLPPLKQWSLSFGQLVPAALLLLSLPPAYDEYRSSEFQSVRNVIVSILTVSRLAKGGRFNGDRHRGFRSRTASGPANTQG